MLTPKQIEDLPENLVRLYAKVEADILADMARRIGTYNYFIPAAEHQYKKAIEMGLLHEEISARISSVLGMTDKEIEALMKEAGVMAIEADDEIYKQAGLNPQPIGLSKALSETMTAGLVATEGLFYNLTKTTAKTATRQFEVALDRAYMQITTGAFNYNGSIRMAVKNLSEKGVAVIEYPSGHADYMEVAVRRAVVTGVNQTAAKMQEARADEMDSDLVETTAHAGARPSHALWQGQIFSRSGKHPKYPDFKTSTGYGTGPGLCGWNCRHNFYPFFEGISSPAYTKGMLENYNAKNYEYNGVKMTEYEASQKQRYIERQIRRWKREECAMKATGLPTDEAKSKIARWQETQRDFIKQTGLKRQYDREQIGKSVAMPKKESIIKNIDIDDMKALAYGKDINNDILDEIYKVMRAGENNGEYYINDISIASIPGGKGGVPLMQIEPIPARGNAMIKLNINSDIISGTTLKALNTRIKMSPDIIANNLKEAVIHETGHAKLISKRSIKDIEQLYEELRDKGVAGISKIAQNDGAECLAEIEILISRGEKVGEEAIKLYEKYMKGVK